jgi:hypothetical protein
MARIKGWVPGAAVAREVITQKGIAPAKRARDDDIYWVSWAKDDVREEDVRRGSGGLINFFSWATDFRDTWKRCVRVPPEVWEGMQKGDPLEVIHIAGDESPYLRNDIFVESGQFVFDLLLLAAEATVAIVMFVQIVKRYRRSQTSAGQVEPPAKK